MSVLGDPLNTVVGQGGNNNGSSIIDSPHYIKLVEDLERLVDDDDPNQILTADNQQTIFGDLKNLIEVMSSHIENSSVTSDHHGYRAISRAVSVLLKQYECAYRLNMKVDELEDMLIASNGCGIGDASFLLADIIRAFGLPNYTTEKNCVAMLQAKFPLTSSSGENTQVSIRSLEGESLNSIDDVMSERSTKNISNVLYEGNNPLELENQKLINLLEEKDKKIEELEEALTATSDEKESLKKEIERVNGELNRSLLQSKYNSVDTTFALSQNLDFDDIKNRMEEEKRKYEEITVQSIGEMNALLEENKGLLDKQRILIDILHKSIDISSKLEDRLLVLKGEYDRLEAMQKIEPLAKEESKEQLNGSEQEVLEILLRVSEQIPEFIGTEVQKILNKRDLPLRDRIEEFSKLLADEIKYADINERDSELKKHVEFLKRQVYSQLKFIRDIGDSRTTLEWLNQYISPDELRAMIVEQSSIITGFIQDNVGEIVEESTLFDSLGINSDHHEFILAVDSFSDTYRNLRNRQAQELYTILCQSLTANDILRRFAERAQEQLVQLSNTIQSMRVTTSSQIQGIKQTCKDELEAVRAELIDSEKGRSELEIIIEEIRSNPDINGMLVKDILDKHGSDSSHEPSQEIRDIITLRNHLEEANRIIKEKDEQMESFKVKIDRELLELTNEVMRLTKESDSREVDAKYKLEDLNGRFESLSADFDRAKTESDGLKEEIIHMQKEKADMISSFNKKIEEVTNKFDEKEGKYQETIKDLQKKERDLQVNLSQQEASFISKMSERLKEIEEREKIALNELQEERNNHKLDIEIRDKLLDELKDALDTSSKAVASSIQESQLLNEQLRSTNQKLESALQENKLLEAKLEKSYNNAERQKTIAESQAKMQLISVRTALEEKVEDIKQEYFSKLRDLHVKITRMFREFVDINKPVTDDQIDNILQKVRNKIDKDLKLNEDAASALRDVNEIRKTLLTPMNIKVSRAVEELFNNYNEEKERSIKLKQNNPEKIIITNNIAKVREWEEWSRKIHSIIDDDSGSVKSMKEIRKRIEDFIHCSSPRGYMRKIKSLKVQKELIKKNIDKIVSLKHTCDGRLVIDGSIRVITIICMAIRRAQKYAGYAGVFRIHSTDSSSVYSTNVSSEII